MPSGWVSDEMRALIGKWRGILVDLGFDAAHLDGSSVPCPFCGGNTRWRFTDIDGLGTWICNHCGSGNGFSLIRKMFKLDTHRTFLKLKELANNRSFKEYEHPTEVKDQGDDYTYYDIISKIERTWKQGRPIKQNDPVHRYLSNRGIDLPDFPRHTRYHPRLTYYHNGSGYSFHPAMVSMIVDKMGMPVALHRTYLSWDGTKANVDTPKKITKPVYRGAVSGASIRLFPHDDTLIVAEGIETAMACHVATGLPSWSAVSANGMAKVEIPSKVRNVVIAADNDYSGAGQEAGKCLAARMRKEGRHVWLRIPDKADTDWADQRLTL